MSITTKKIRGREYLYFDYYNERGEKRTRYLGKKGREVNKTDKEFVLRVWEKKLEDFANKLNSFSEMLGCNLKCESCERVMDSRKKDVQRREKNLPLFTVSWSDEHGIHVSQVCLDCFWLWLEFGFARRQRSKHVGFVFMGISPPHYIFKP